MDTSTNRRAELKRASVIAAGSCFSGQVASAQSGDTSISEKELVRDEPVGELSAHQEQSRIWVRINGRPFACYRAGSDQKYPYFYPLLGPATGLPMTEESAEPWPHHHSMFLGCDHVNGGNYWQDDQARGQIVSRGPTISRSEPGRVVLHDRCEWRRPGQDPILDDEREYAFTLSATGCRLIDIDITLAARQPVEISKTNHSLFAIRAARDLAPVGGGRLFNDAGQEGEAGTFGQVARWCGYEASRLGQTEAIVLMDHPSNPWSPCPWFTRDYGFISPTPFQWLKSDSWRLPKGQSIRLRYRVALVRKGQANQQIRLAWDAFAAGG